MISAVSKTLTTIGKRSTYIPILTRGFSDVWKEKEKAMEKSYFNKEDEKALRKLLKKMKSQTDQVDAKGKKEHREHDLTGLKRIISDANLSQDKIDALMKWKHE